MIVMYDLEDNLITIFNTYKECAKYFDTSVKSIRCYISRNKKGTVDKKRDKKNQQWVRLFNFKE